METVSKTDSKLAITTSAYVLIFIFIGLPLWWKTTTVYRYSLPHSECHNLLSEKMKHNIISKIVLGDSEVQQGLFWEQLLKLGKTEHDDKSQPVITFQWSMSIASEEEASIIKQSKNTLELDQALNSYERNARGRISQKKLSNEFTILVLSKNFSDDQKFSVGGERRGYILNNGGCENLARDVIFLVKKMAQVERLQKLYTPATLYSGEKTPDKDQMRYLRATKSFDITFSLIVPEPQVLDVTWNIENAVNEYFKNVIDQLNLISSIKVKSQILYMTPLPIPLQLPQTEKKEFILQSEYLPSLINPIEDKLGSDVSLKPNLNFVVYIPPKRLVPLRIHDGDGKSLPLNAFLLPQWGGFLIYNYLLPKNASLPFPVDVNMQSIMEIFMSQFRLLIGLQDVGFLTNDSILELKGPIIREWEKDFLLRKNAQEHLSSSISSLSSLSHLLKKIKNIVICDDIGQKIHFSLSSTKASLKLLSEGHLEEGFKLAQAAFVASDEAFFDPSLLALLYFPEDQKYAIYIPLFLPIGIPVVTSLGYLYRFWQEYQQNLKSA